MKRKYLLFLILLFINYTALSKQVLTLATTHWCPYTCDFKGNANGIVGDIIKNSLLNHGISLTVQHFPWSRAINLVNSNKIDGLLTATPEEAPNLLFSDSPIGNYQMCFYTLPESNWLLKPTLNLDNNILLVIQDYGYGEPLDSYITENKQTVMTISGDDSINRSIKMLSLGRVDIIIEDKIVIQWALDNKNVSDIQIREAGCLKEQPFYFALSPNKKNITLMKELNETFVEVNKEFSRVVKKEYSPLIINEL